MKQCPSCKVSKSLRDFYVSSDRRDGHASWCKECFKQIANKAGKRNRVAGLCRCGKKRRRNKKDCQSCADYARDYKNRRRQDPNYVMSERQEQRRRHLALKEVVYAHYGKTCQCCGEEKTEFLSIDHTEPLGSYPADAPRAGAKLYAWLRRNKFPSGFRTLCMNCNWSLGHFGYCPHKI